MSSRVALAATLLGLILIMSLGRAAQGQVQQLQIKDDGTFVIDRAHVFSGDQEPQLENWLRELEQKTGTQLKVLAIPTTSGEDIFAFSQRVGEQWKLGRKESDNGVLVVLAVNDRKVRIQTGYGIEPILPDSWCGTQSREVAQTYFRDGRYAQGITELALRAANRIASAQGVQLVGVPAPQKLGDEPEGSVPSILLLFVLVIVAMLFIARRRRRDYFGRRPGGIDWWYVPTSTWSGGSSWGSSGGSWGSGFGGGGSFGGGGRFGGGGGGASW